jgi:uncharacterized protein (TIGR02646 family)
MIELQHQLSQPPALSTYRKQNPGSAWDDPNFESIRPDIRHQLNLEQEGLCVYCENLLTEDEGHIEHIKPRSLNPALTFAYNNLAHSCDGQTHCGHHKKHQQLPVEPRPGCNRFFALMALDGNLVPTSELTASEAQQAIDTLNILGLNVPALAWRCKGYVEAIRYLSDPTDVAAFIATEPFRWSLRGIFP